VKFQLMLALVFSVAALLGPATTPSTRPSDTESDLRRIIGLLQKQITSLKTENAGLKKELDQSRHEYAAMRAEWEKLAATQPSAGDDIQRAIIEEKLIVGMTLAQAKQALKNYGDPREEGAVGGAITYRWARFINNRPSSGTEGYSATFENNTLVAYSKFP
jgi:FtsZ-binding cell division protein ZapB